MSLFALDLALRAGTVALLLVLSASLLRDFRNVVAGRLAIALALGSAAHVVTSGIGATTPVSVAHAPLIALSTGNVVVLWLFTRALFDDSLKLRWWHALIWAAVATFSFVNCMWIAPGGNARISIIAINVLALGFILLAVGQTIASWSADLVECHQQRRAGLDRCRDQLCDDARRWRRTVCVACSQRRERGGCGAGRRGGSKTGRRADAVDGG